MTAVKSPRPLASLGLVLALCAGVSACGGDDDDSSDTAAPGTEAPAATTAPTTEETTAPEPTTPQATTPEATTPATEAPAELADSYRGVTADSITIGVLLLDAQKLLENAGVELNWGDNQGQYQSAIDAINEAGGVLGRQIEPIYVFVDPLSETGYQEACVQLTEDEEVFAVVGFTRPADAALCYAETGDTPFVGYLSDITSDVMARATLPIITSNALPERLDRALVSVVADAGELEGKTIAVIGNTEGSNQLIADTLTELGYEAVSQTVTAAPTDDAVADAAEFDIVVQKWISEGVDFVFDTAGLDRQLAAANRAGFEATFATSTPSILSLSRFDSGATEAEVARTLVVAEPSIELLVDQGHEPTVSCVERWDTNHPEEPAVFFPTEDELDNLIRIARTCQQIGTFALIAEAAGPDLTTESFAAAVGDVGSFDIAMLPFASLSADKWDANDVVTLFRWDSTQQDFIAGE
ncbi:MAG TPA: ABC transporter substrate-binding protein, partial [Ilumatobacteraceae bacterium]|nr:ABC transporter substrate-binding protein [Ilumatobacteraceae bacterium]